MHYSILPVKIQNVSWHIWNSQG